MKNMQKYNGFQRMANIINRAMTEFDYELDMQDSLEEIFDGAWNVITDNVDYDRVEECEMSNSHSHLYWADDMGYVGEADGQFMSSSAQANRWMRKGEDGKFFDIEWFEADQENDYVVVHFDFDSEGQLVCLVAK